MDAIPIESVSYTRIPTTSRRLHPTASSLSLPLWTATEIANAVNGQIIKWGPPGTISTDTRTLIPHQWFFALHGQNFDGHDFITPDLPCVGVIGNRVCHNWDRGFVRFGNDGNALEKMGIYARDRFRGSVVGVTGSVGKTTTREMISLALGGAHQSVGNQNNEIGVALTLIGIPGNAEVVVVEMGMRRSGEILKLARMSRPDIRVVLNVGASHLENFECLEEIGSAKGELLREMRDGDVCVLNADDPLVMRMHVPRGVKKVLFGRKRGSDICLISAKSIYGGHAVQVVLEWNFEMVRFVIHSPGLHLAHNACAAAAVSVLLGVPLPQIAFSLSKFSPVHMRSELIVAENGIKIINDVYNASLASTKAAIALLKAIDCRGKRVAILGDMLELGQAETYAHEMVLNLCCVVDIGFLALVGENFSAAAKNLRLDEMTKVICMLDAEAMALKIAESLNKDDVVLVKGSRGMEMEKVVDAVEAIRWGI